MPTIYHPYPDDIVLLMHFDGTLQDSGPLGQGFTNYGTGFAAAGQFSQALDVGGTFPGGGGTNRVQSAAARLEYDLNGGDYTLEAWVQHNGAADGNARSLISVLGGAQASAVEYALAIQGASGTVYAKSVYTVVSDGSGGISSLTGVGVALPANTPTHLRATRSGGNYYLFVGGVLVQTGSDLTRAPAGAKTVCIGNLTPTLNGALSGWVDEICITRRCLSTASFTPPVGPYSSYWPSVCRAWPGGMA